ncbi:MAG: molybdate transport system permease protein [Chloroflexota bacterium]|nr:molybdate transport system permease protein [Chloroflexota bacterium]
MTQGRPPLGLLIPAGGAVALVLLPLVGLLQRTPWTRMGTLLLAPDVGTALRLSLECSVAAVALSLLLGVPLAWMLARVHFPGRPLVRALVTLPMVLPPVVGGVALLLAFGRRGFVGEALERLTGLTLPFTTAGAVLAEAFVAMPFLVVAVEAGLRQVDRRYEEAAATLGAGPWTRFWRVTLPLVAPSLGAGAALCWARALGEFGATITFAGNFPGKTQTMPLAVYIALETNPDGAVALSVILLVVSLVVLVGLRHRLGSA